MGAIKINRVTNANVYVNGNSILGQAEEVKVPEVKHKGSEHKALGLMGSPEFFAGIDKLEATIKWNSFYADTLKLFADPFTSLSLQVRASLEEYGSTGRTAEKPVVIYLTAQSSNFPSASFKQHDNVDVESTLRCTYYKMVIDGKDIIEVDIMANIYKVGGVDMLAGYKANIGG